jgi:hypothetical protein
MASKTTSNEAMPSVQGAIAFIGAWSELGRFDGGIELRTFVL